MSNLNWKMKDAREEDKSHQVFANLVLDLSDQRSDDDCRSCEDRNSDYFLQRSKHLAVNLDSYLASFECM